MDLETENRLAGLLMEEARRLRVQAEKEGVHVYLQQPNVRGRPNARFLTATVLGVQQANRAVEVGDMWRAREKELKLEAKLKSRGRKRDGSSLQEGCSTPSHEEAHRNSSSRNAPEDCYSSDDNGGLRDEEVEEFLHSRAKRGRGDIGSRMDEPGPYISSTSSGHQLMETRTSQEWEHRILGPEKPSFLKPHNQGSKKQHRPKEERRSRKEESARKEKSSSKHHHLKSRRRD